MVSYRQNKIDREVFIMQKRNEFSLWLSQALALLFFAGLLFGACILPAYLNAIDGGTFTLTQHGTILAIGYGILVIAALADVLLIRLLWQVRRGNVFISTNVTLLRGLSWCCLLAGALFLWLGLFFLLSYAVAFVAVLVGLCLRVVKNAFAEAIEIKSENDLTV